MAIFSVSPRLWFVALRERVGSEDSTTPGLKTLLFIPPPAKPALGPRPPDPLPSSQSQRVHCRRYFPGTHAKPAPKAEKGRNILALMISLTLLVVVAVTRVCRRGDFSRHWQPNPGL